MAPFGPNTTATGPIWWVHFPAMGLCSRSGRTGLGTNKPLLSQGGPTRPYVGDAKLTRGVAPIGTSLLQQPGGNR
eukprot:11202094-Lingulodinium_polyedra.AAC.1